MFVQVRACYDTVGKVSHGNAMLGQVSRDYFMLCKVMPGYDRLGH